MSDAVIGTAVLARDQQGAEWLHIICSPTAGPRAGHPFAQRIPVRRGGQQTPHGNFAWQYTIGHPTEVRLGAAPGPGRETPARVIEPGTLNVSPSVKVSVAKWNPKTENFGPEQEEIFHNGAAWSVRFVECPALAGAYSHLREVNPGVSL